MIKFLIENLLAISLALNAWILIYSIPKVKREVKYWQRRATWQERYIDELEAECLSLSGSPGQEPPK